MNPLDGSPAPGSVPGHNVPPDDGALKPGDKADRAVARALRLRALIDRTEDRVKRLKNELAALQRHEIPELLAEIGTTIWPTGGGGKVEVETKIMGSLSKAGNIEEAVAYLEKMGFAGAMETTLSVTFTSEERQLAADMAKAINATTNHTVILDRAVHPQTLSKWARDRFKAGKPVDHSLIGLSLWREARLPKN